MTKKVYDAIHIPAAQWGKMSTSRGCPRALLYTGLAVGRVKIERYLRPGKEKAEPREPVGAEIKDRKVDNAALKAKKTKKNAAHVHTCGPMGKKENQSVLPQASGTL